MPCSRMNWLTASTMGGGPPRRSELERIPALEEGDPHCDGDRDDRESRDLPESDATHTEPPFLALRATSVPRPRTGCPSDFRSAGSLATEPLEAALRILLAGSSFYAKLDNAEEPRREPQGDPRTTLTHAPAQ